MTSAAVPKLARRRRVDRERLLRSMPGYPFDHVRDLQSWDIDLGEFYASVIVARENIGADGPSEDWRWHVSVSGVERVPEWSEFASIVHEMRPGVTFCMALPPRSWWINLAENCLHAWEIEDVALEDLWRSERRGDDPS